MPINRWQQTAWLEGHWSQWEDSCCPQWALDQTQRQSGLR